MALLLTIAGLAWSAPETASSAAKEWDAVADGGFEGGSPSQSWQEHTDTAFSIITGDYYAAHEGLSLAVFSGSDDGNEEGWVEQTVELGNNTAELIFYLRITSTSGNGQDILRALIDGNEVFAARESELGSYTQYRRVAVDVSRFADGKNHVLRFRCFIKAFLPSLPVTTVFHLDDVQLMTANVPLFATFSWSPQYPVVTERVQLLDESTGSPNAWSWSFGDGATASSRNPGHRYGQAGSYQVKLEVTNHLEQHSSMTQTIEIYPAVSADFEWSPQLPAVAEQISFTDRSTGSPDQWLWSLGDGTTSTEQHPHHSYAGQGSYEVSLTAANPASQATLTRTVMVGAPPRQIDFTIANPSPAIGEEVLLTITGTDTVDQASWTFGGPGCGSPESLTCTDPGDACLHTSYRYASAGSRVVTLSVVVNGEPYGPFSHSLQVQEQGRCEGAPAAQLSWFPPVIKRGTDVQLVYRADLSPGMPDTWSWSFGDGGSSTARHPSHRFQEAGSYEVSLTVANSIGSDTATRVLTVLGQQEQCGDQVCDEGESWFSCPVDCAPARGTTGRAGLAGRLLYVPVVAGGVAGVEDTFWLTEAMLYNNGAAPALCVIGLSPDDGKGQVQWAGPIFLGKEQTRVYSNLVLELFDSTTSGSLWLRSSQPLMLDTRTFNQTGDGTFGQAVAAIPWRSFIGEGDGAFYLIGLSENDHFRTNLIVQEVMGEPAEVLVRAWDRYGSMLGQRRFTVAGRSKRLRRLASLGFTELSNGYLTLEVNGAGKVVALASVVDQVTGDGTTIDAVHPRQVLGPAGKAGAEQSHLLVAVVARVPGLNDTLWRTSLTVQNPAAGSQTLRAEYRPAAGEPMIFNGKLAAGELFHTDDLLGQFFAGAGDSTGSLHIFTDEGLIVDSRVYNQLPDGGTMGQSLPGLGSGDMARFGETWVLNKLKSTDDFRCNIGFAEYAGADTEVVIVLWDTGGAARRFLGSKTYSVKALGNAQVNQVFADMGLHGTYQEAMAYASLVNEDDGALYIYASVIDNTKGDGSTVLAKRK